MIWLSIIIPARNAQKDIEKCLKSLTKQKDFQLGKDYEIIVVNDGSQDNTAKLLQKYAVQVINLKTPQGRLKARIAGAEEAQKQLLFIDSKVTVPENFLLQLRKYLSYYPVVMAGNVQTYSPRIFPRLFYLIRRRWYGRKNFPHPDRSYLITDKNFQRSPKGTTTLSLPKNVFLSAIPEAIKEHTNDDTKFLRAIVSEQKISILRAKNLVIFYHTRTGFWETLQWLFDRGTSFSDYYLARHWPLAAAVIALSIVALFLLPTILISALVLFLFAACLFLAEDVQDIPITFLLLPLSLMTFFLGICRYIASRLPFSQKQIITGINSLVLVFFLIYIWQQREAIHHLKNITVFDLVALFALLSGFFLVNGLMILVILRGFGIKASSDETLSVSILSSLTNYLPAPGGMGLKAVYFKQRFQLRYEYFAALFAASYIPILIVNMAASFLSALLVSRQLGQLQWQALLVFGGLFLATAIVWLSPIVRKTLTLLLKFSPKFQKLSILVEGWEQLRKSWRTTQLLLLLSLGNFILGTTIIWLEYQAISNGAFTNVSWVQSAFQAGLSSLSVFLGITPGGIGIRESFLLLGSAALHISVQQTLAASLLDRALNLVALAIWSPIAWLIISRRWKFPQKS